MTPYSWFRLCNTEITAHVDGVFLRGGGCSANGTMSGQPATVGGQLGLAGFMLASMFLRLILVLVPIFVVCRVLAFMRDASLRSYSAAAEPRLRSLDRELHSLVQVSSQ